MMWIVALLATLAVGCGAAERAAPPAPAPAPAPAPPPETVEAKRAAFAAAYRLIQRQQFEEAGRLLEALLPRYPELEDYCLHFLALAHARRGAPGQALELWSQLADRHPRSLHAAAGALERGRIQRARGEFEAARRLLALARDDGEGEVSHAATFELAETAAATGDTGGAHRQLEAIRQAVPGSALGTRAKRRVEELRRLDPSLAPAGAALERELHLLIRERDHAAAIAVAERLLATAADAERPALLRLRATAEHGAGRIEESLATLRQIFQRHPSSAAAPEALFRYASLLWNRDRDAEARASFLEFRRRHPRRRQAPEALYAIARIDQQAGATRLALAHYAELARAYPRSRLAREARWRIGWIHYRNGHWDLAADAFAGLGRGARITEAADALYWQARALEHAGRHGAARALYRRLVGAAPASYYAHWAERRLGQAAPASPPMMAPGGQDDIGDAPAAASDRYHLTRARELHAAGLRSLARRELRAFERANPSSAEVVGFLIDAYPAADGYRDAMRLRRGSATGDPRWLYPLAFWPLISQHRAPNGLDPWLVVALIRQESMFDPEARSHADARGLMQLLPRTAEELARQLREPLRIEDLYEPETNIAFGMAYLDQLLRRYGGDRLKALAAYNAGEDAVAKWERRFGRLEPDEFVESITYRETRDYVKKVVANHRQYHRLYAAPAAPAPPAPAADGSSSNAARRLRAP